MKIIIKRLRLTNFKGIPDFEISPENQTTISADNAVGKTTLFDAHNWLWTGKDSQDRKDFEIKPLDKNGKASSRVISEVEETIDVDGQEIVLRRCFEEKWVKKRGSTETEYAGNETKFWYNEVPCNQSEFKAKIDALISEDKTKLLTNPHYFNDKLSWQQRRAILTDMAGEVSDEEVLDTIATVHNKTELGALISALNNKDLEEYKKEVAAKRKLVKEKLEQIPTRIDEAERSKPQPVDAGEINKAISEIENAASEIDTRISGLQKAQEEEYQVIADKMREKNALSARIQEEKSNVSLSINHETNRLLSRKSDLESEGVEISGKIKKLDIEIRLKTDTCQTLSSENDALRADFEKIAGSQFTPPSSENCPSCGKPVEIELDPEKLKSDFEENKTRHLDSKRTKGLANKAEIETLTTEISAHKLEKGDLESQMEANKEAAAAVQKEIDANRSQPGPTNETIIALEKELAELVIPEVAPVDIAADQARKKELEKQIAELRASLSANEQIERLNIRINELKAEEKTLAQELANHEKVENTIMAFSKAKIEAVEKKVSGMFQLVTFKMFNDLINGGEEPTCVCMVNGVPYGDLNTAAKINAGLDIINTLSNHYGVYAPIWIDGRESINEVLPVQSQMIHLKVGLEKKLTILK